MFKQDAALTFLETVSYDEIMAYHYLLSSQNDDEEYGSPEWSAMCEIINEVAKETYGWDEDRLIFLGTLINFHCADVACEDWRFNYFWAVAKSLPDAVLEEQFPTLKKLGDKLTALKRNALSYKCRMLEILMVQDSISGMYSLIHLEDSSIELPELENLDKTVAWRNTQSRTIAFIIETIDKHLDKIVAYSPTPDLKRQFAVTQSGYVRIVKFKNQIKLVGMNGTIDLTNIKLSCV